MNILAMKENEIMEEVVPIDQAESKNGLVADDGDVHYPYVVRRSQGNKYVCCSRERRKSTIPVFVITGIGILVLVTVIVCIVVETISTRTDPWGTKIWNGHNVQERLYHLAVVAYINQRNTSWKAKYNRFATRATEMNAQEMWEIYERGKWLKEEEVIIGDTVEHLHQLKSIKLELPQQFDARLRWPLCWSVHQVSNQGGCGSCWAMSAASVMSDRLCIATNYTNQKQISSQDLISCCTECGGCQGSHWAISTFIYWRNHGIVTGGDYGSFEGCKPYTFAPDCGVPCSFQYYIKKATPICEQICQPLYENSYEEDLIQSQQAYWIRAEKGSSETMPSVEEAIREVIGSNDPVELIKREIYLYGPVLACFTVQEDFQHYDSGIYQTDSSSASQELYGHCAKLLGWGEEAGLKYWLYMNTWGRNWGEAGFFRVSESEVPEEVVAGLLYTQ